MTRPRTFTIAAILQALLSLLGMLVAMPLLLAGQSAATDPSQLPFALLAFGVGILGLAAAYGVWRVLRWAVILAILLRVLDALLFAPILLSPPDTTWLLLAIAGIGLSVLVVVLLLWPQPKAAPAAGRAV